MVNKDHYESNARMVFYSDAAAEAEICSYPLCKDTYHINDLLVQYPEIEALCFQ